MTKKNKLRLLSTLLLVICSAFLSGCAGGVLGLGAPQPLISEAAITSAKQIDKQQNIVLMLPLKGSLASTSQAIRNGFLAAYYYAKATQPDVKIKVVDTTDVNVASLYNQAVLSGANMVVGPLTKQEVEVIANMPSLSVPVIALNSLDDFENHSAVNLYQFGLLPQDEAKAIANKIVSANHLRTAIIAPEGPWGEKIVNAFKEKLEASGGQVVVTLNYAVGDDLAQQICQMIAADPSQMCVRRKYQNRNKDALPAPSRRQDIDNIFVVATPRQGRQIVPLLKFYYAGDLPVYSISSIYSGKPMPNLDQDLNGVTFCDTPWVLRESVALSPELQAMRKQIETLWGSSAGNNRRLNALGIDAYNLTQSLSEILAAPQNGFSGASGTLFLDSYNHFYRELTFAKFQDGVPKEM